MATFDRDTAMAYAHRWTYGNRRGDQALQEHEIPYDLKKLEYQDFKFDVPVHGAITFKMADREAIKKPAPECKGRRAQRLRRAATRNPNTGILPTVLGFLFKLFCSEYSRNIC